MDTVWNRLDEHRTEITRLREGQAGMESRLRALEDRTDRMLAAMTEARAESNHHFDQLYDRLSEMDGHIQQARGGLRVGLWIAGAIGTLMGFLAAMAALAKNLLR